MLPEGDHATCVQCMHCLSCETCRSCACTETFTRCQACKSIHCVDCDHCLDFKWANGYGVQRTRARAGPASEFLQWKDSKDPGTGKIQKILDEWNLFHFAETSFDLGKRRFAFVLGNDSYPTGGVFNKLSKAVADSEAIADQLQRLGFEVHKGGSLKDKNEMDIEHEILEWSRCLPGNGVALLYMSGHGMELNGKQYYVPVESCTYYGNTSDWRKDTIVESAQAKCVSFDWIMDRLKSVLRRDGLIITFWDCCRENELEMRRVVRAGPAAGGDSLIPGISALKTKLLLLSPQDRPGHFAVSGSLADCNALDGGRNAENGPLTAAVLKWLRDPTLAALNIDHFKVKEFVNAEVSQLTNGEQIPDWCLKSNIKGTTDFCFAIGDNV